LYKLKQRKPSLKILIAVGGWTAKSDGFNEILTNSSTRMIFIQNTKDFLFEWNFDGIDLVISTRDLIEFENKMDFLGLGISR